MNDGYENYKMLLCCCCQLHCTYNAHNLLMFHGRYDNVAVICELIIRTGLLVVLLTHLTISTRESQSNKLFDQKYNERIKWKTL